MLNVTPTALFPAILAPVQTRLFPYLRAPKSSWHPRQAFVSSRLAGRVALAAVRIAIDVRVVSGVSLPGDRNWAPVGRGASTLLRSQPLASSQPRTVKAVMRPLIPRKSSGIRRSRRRQCGPGTMRIRIKANNRWKPRHDWSSDEAPTATTSRVAYLRTALLAFRKRRRSPRSSTPDKGASSMT